MGWYMEEGFRGSAWESAARASTAITGPRQAICSTHGRFEGQGAALMQEHDEKCYPVAYGSNKLTSTKRRYPNLEKELLAIVRGEFKFCPYLAGKNLQTNY